MKYVIVHYDETEVVDGIVEAESAEEIKDALFKLSEPYNLANAYRIKSLRDYGPASEELYNASNECHKIGRTKVKFYNTELAIGTLYFMTDCEIIPLEEFIRKHTL